MDILESKNITTKLQKELKEETKQQTGKDRGNN